MADVEFDAERFEPTSHAQPGRKKDWADTLVARGYVKTRAQAQALLLGVAAVCLVAAIGITFAGGTPEPDPEVIRQLPLPGSR